MRVLAIWGMFVALAACIPVQAMPLGIRMAMSGRAAAYAREEVRDPMCDALGTVDLSFSTGGDADWFVQTDVVHGGESALRSGAIGDMQETWLATSVNGAGEISFWWKASSEHYRQYLIDYVVFTVDGKELARLGGDSEWTNVIVAVEGHGDHHLCWTYLKDDMIADGDDCAWLDEVSWTSAPSSDVSVDLGGGKSVVVPVEWIDSYVDIVAAAGGDKAAALQRTAANGRKVWECFMLGVDPTDPSDDFRITRFWMENGEPKFEFSHKTDGSGNLFLPYVKPLGKAQLSDKWRHVPESGNPAFRFFTVEVVPPGCESSIVGEEVDNAKRLDVPEQESCPKDCLSEIR